MKSSPLNELTAQDIARKKIKLGKIEEKLSDTNINPRKERRLKEKQHKTKYQIDTGKRGRPTSLRNEEWLAGTSRKSSSPANNLTEGDEIVSSAEGSANYRKSALNMLGVKSSPLNDMTEQENAAHDAIDAIPDSDAVSLGVIKPSRFTKLKTKLEDTYADAGKSDEFRNKDGGGEHQDFYYDPNKFAEEGKNYHGIIPGDDKMGMIRSGAIEYPEDMENIPEHYKGKNWVPNKK